jgi:hypothetical protein
LEIERDVPSGGEGVQGWSVAEHTPERYKGAGSEELLLQSDVPAGGEGVCQSVADHTPDHLKHFQDEKPLLDH